MCGDREHGLTYSNREPFLIFKNYRIILVGIINLSVKDSKFILAEITIILTILTTKA